MNITFQAKYRTRFIFGSMIAAVGGLVFDAYFFHGWVSAAVWGFGFSFIYLLYAFSTEDLLFEKFIFFGMTAGWIELLPDNWMVVHTGTLVYGKDQPIIDSSPFYMPFSWLAVFIQIGYIGFLLSKKYSLLKASIITAILGSVITPVYEHLAIVAGWWSYRDTPTILDVPYYIILAEGLLMLSIPFFYRQCERSRPWKVPLLGLLQGLFMWLCCYVSFKLLG